MDHNVVILCGHLAAQPEIRTFDSGSTLMRLLVTVRAEESPGRLDVVPVVQWQPDLVAIPDEPLRGMRIWIVGAVQRRFWSANDGRHSRVEIVAHAVEFKPETSEMGVEIAASPSRTVSGTALV